MSDIIQLLPDSIASQIAAGEVIQRPSSVVKELIENSIDAGADEITLVIKDAGKTLIQVLDNGIGMSPTDSRMCFERHATSKIRDANDIFKIDTKGFRGEALASVAAISHVELISRQKTDELGTKVVIIGSKFSKQESVQSDFGTKISIKNLFFNVPARRKFLKSDTVEYKHIIDEFFRLAIAHNNISFSLYHNGRELYRLLKTSLKQRIVSIFGKGFENKLLPIEENMELLSISGFVGKIDATRKSRNNQFIFVNNRYIKSNYLAHAIKSAYEEYIPEDQNPIYFLFLSTDPANIDVNIHPTKQEIKFEDEKLIYNYIKVVIKKILGRFHYTPSLEFDKDKNFDLGSAGYNKNVRNDFDSGSNIVSSKMKKTPSDEWEKAFEILNDKKESLKDNIKSRNIEIPSKLNNDSLNFEEDKKISTSNLFQINRSYIVKEVETGILLIDQYYSHERILYEKYLNLFSSDNYKIQQLLFPETIFVNDQDKDFLKEILPELKKFGFLIKIIEQDEILLEGVPALMGNHTKYGDIINDILQEPYKDIEIVSGLNKKIAGVIAGINAKNKGQKLTQEEMNYLVENLFACKNPYKSPKGKKTFIIIETKEIINRFNS
jgi:DNA mismatch repair protein MutL